VGGGCYFSYHIQEVHAWVPVIYHSNFSRRSDTVAVFGSIVLEIADWANIFLTPRFSCGLFFFSMFFPPL